VGFEGEEGEEERRRGSYGSVLGMPEVVYSRYVGR
jgi:hypothetical protein